jgi:hypothetical protein
MRERALGIFGVRACLLGAALAAGALIAGQSAARAAADQVGIELNKLSSGSAGCQAYFVFDNQGEADYGKLKIDLVVFNSDDVFERRFAMSVAPLDGKKRTLRMFELEKITCDKIGSFLINGVLECEQGKKAKTDCVQRLVPSSRVDVELSK